MSYFPADMPRPEPTMDEVGFWTLCSKQQLRFQSCAQCGTMRHPPIPMCPRCQSCEIDWKEAPPGAEVYSYTVVHHASHPAVIPRLPYVVAVVEFPALPGVRLATNITDVDPCELRIGQKVKLWWDELGEGMFIPRFKPEAYGHSIGGPQCRLGRKQRDRQCGSVSRRAVGGIARESLARPVAWPTMVTLSGRPVSAWRACNLLSPVALLPWSIWALVLGVVTIDFGLQSVHVYQA